MKLREIYEEALKNAEEANIDEALRLYRDLLEESEWLDSIRASAYNDLGVLFYHGGHMEKATEYFTRASKLDPDSPDIQANIELIRNEITKPAGFYVRTPAREPEREGRTGHFFEDTIIKDLHASIPQDAAKILIIGCGEGSLGSMIKKNIKSAEITGIERDAMAAAKASEILDRVIVADLEKISLLCPAEYFDCIVYNGIVEHLHDPLAVLKEYAAFLSEKGTIVTAVPNVQHFSVITDLLMGKWSYTSEGALSTGHLRFFTHHELRSLFKKAGFSIKKVKGYDLYPLPEKYKELIARGRELNLISPGFDTETISYYYTISAQKARTVTMDSSRDIAFSSERMIPGKSDWKVEHSHQIRYNFLGPLAKNRRVLDAGCGEGYGAFALSRHGRHVTAVERDSATAAYARTFYKRENLQFLNGDLLSMDFDEPFEVIYALGILEQAADAEQFLSQMKKALCGGGIIVLSVSNRLISSPDSSRPANPFHRAEWNAEEFLALLAPHFNSITLLCQSDEGIMPLEDPSRTKAPHFIALCSSSGTEALYQELRKEWVDNRTSIILVAHNNREATAECIESIARFTYDPYELIAVDNSSSDGTREKLQGRAQMLIARDENIGYWGASMEGVAAAGSKTLALVHNDIVVSNNWLGKLRAPLSLDSRIAAAGPLSNRAPESQHQSVIYEDFDEFLIYAKTVEKEHFERYRKADFLSDFCMVIRRDSLQQAGFSENSLPATSKKLFKALKKAGLHCVIKEDTFIHHKEKKEGVRAYES